MKHRLIVVAPLVFIAACGSSSESITPSGTDAASADVKVDDASDAPIDANGDATVDPCASAKPNVIALDPKTAKEADVQKAFVSAKPGDVLQLGEGTFSFTNGLVLAANCVTVRGAGMDKTILDFSGQLAGSEGIYGDHPKAFVLEALTVRDTKGNGVKVLGADGLTFRKVKTEWTGADATKHGAYGLYPVESKRVLIEDCVATGANDSGIYVGQSNMVVTRRNRAEQNVAGIEIENTFNADVYENVAIHNTAGILVFDLPGLPQLGGNHVRVFKNTIKDNNTKNFAAKGDIVSMVPAGVGFFVMANHDVEVFGNTFDGNTTAHSSVVSYYVTQLDIKDAKYYPWPASVFLHDNTYLGGGDAPDTDHDLGALLAVNKDKFPGGVSPQIIYDGILDPAKTTPADNPMQLCLKGNVIGGTSPAKDASFANMHLDKLPKGSIDIGPYLTTDTKPHACTPAALPAVTWPGLAP